MFRCIDYGDKTKNRQWRSPEIQKCPDTGPSLHKRLDTLEDMLREVLEIISDQMDQDSSDGLSDSESIGSVKQSDPHPVQIAVTRSGPPSARRRKVSIRGPGLDIPAVTPVDPAVEDLSFVASPAVSVAETVLDA